VALLDSFPPICLSPLLAIKRTFFSQTSLVKQTSSELGTKLHYTSSLLQTSLSRVIIDLSYPHIIMSSQYAQQYYGYPQSQPISMPPKQGYQAYPQYQHNAYSRISGSPPEAPESATTGSGVTSYDPSAASSSYAGSASEYDPSSNGAQSVDLLDYMNDRLSSNYNPMPLDRSLAQQAQT
jgi:hypothetical protein